MRLPPVELKLLLRRVKIRNSESLQAPELPPGDKPSAHPHIRAAPYGDGGANITAVAALRLRSIVRSCWQSLIALHFGRQVSEIQIRIAVLNRYIHLGIPFKEAAG